MAGNVSVNDLSKRQVAVIYGNTNVVAFINVLLFSRLENVGQQALIQSFPECGTGSFAVEFPRSLELNNDVVIA